MAHGSVGKLLLCKTECQGLALPHPHKKLDMEIHICNSTAGGGDRWIPEPHCPARLAKSVSFRYSEKPLRKYTCTHSHAVHTHTHAPKLTENGDT